MRKVVQIAVSSENEEIPWNLFALCDDGTIWRKQQVKSSVCGARVRGTALGISRKMRTFTNRRET